MKLMLTVLSILHICQSSQIGLNSLDTSLDDLQLFDSKIDRELLDELKDEIAKEELLNQEKRFQRTKREAPRVGREVPRVGRDIPRLGREVPRVGREIPRLGREVPRLGREIPRLGREVPRIGREIPRLGREIPRLGREVPKLGREIPRLGREVPRLGREVPRLGREIPRLGREVPRVGKDVTSIDHETLNLKRMTDDDYLDELLSTYTKLKREVTEDILNELKHTEQGKRILQAFGLGSHDLVMKKYQQKDTGKAQSSEDQIAQTDESGLDDDGYQKNKRQTSFLHIKRKELKTLLKGMTGNEPK